MKEVAAAFLRVCLCLSLITTPWAVSEQILVFFTEKSSFRKWERTGVNEGQGLNAGSSIGDTVQHGEKKGAEEQNEGDLGTEFIGLMNSHGGNMQGKKKETTNLTYV